MTSLGPARISEQKRCVKMVISFREQFAGAKPELSGTENNWTSGHVKPRL